MPDNKPVKKTKQQEREDRITRTKDLLSEGWSPAAVKEAIRKRWGELSARTIQDYITEARALILKDIGVPVDQLRSEAYAFLCHLRVAEGSTNIVKLRAQEAINKLLQLDKPILIANSNPDGTFGQKPLTPAELRAAMENALTKALTHEDVVAGNPDGLPAENAGEGIVPPANPDSA
jgi:hypothetical protein